jgi:hypothetical protein
MELIRIVFSNLHKIKKNPNNNDAEIHRRNYNERCAKKSCIIMRTCLMLRKIEQLI